MPMEIHKEQIRLNEVLCSEYARATAESDIIVPDINPDILKVLRVSAAACITQKSVQQGRAYIQGIVRINILYIPEDDLSGKIKCINATLDFSHVINAEGAKPGMILCAEADCEKTEDNLINSRKLNIKCTLGINVKIISPKETEAAVPSEDNCGLELKTEKFGIICATPDYDAEFTLKEVLPLPGGKPAAAEILKADAVCFTSELKISDKRAALRGEARLSVLYRAATDESGEAIECAEYTLPFTEAPDGAELKEGMEGEADYSVKSIVCTPCDSEDGANTALSVEITVCAAVRGFETSALSVLSDAYGKDFNVDIEKKAFDIERFLGSGYIQLPQKEVMEVPDYLPEIMKVCDVAATPVVSSVEISDGKVLVSGSVCANVLYITRSSDLPVAGFEQSFEFSHSFDIPDIKEDAICEAKVTPEHISYTLSGDRTLSLRIITALSLKCMVLEKTMLIESIEKNDEPVGSGSPVSIYFVQPGDTLWSIAKRYRTSVKNIMEDNELESDRLQTGDIIKIFR